MIAFVVSSHFMEQRIVPITIGTPTGPRKAIRFGCVLDKSHKNFIPDPSRRTILLLFTIYLQSLHFYLQSKPLDPKNIKVDSLNQFEKT